MWRVGAASEKYYEGQNINLRQMGGEVKVNWLDTDTGKTEVLQCRAR